ncbi:hypothetical protein ONZ45_g3571 [Pleurotus djamor]|nr:hypothetical protein ONZ45_g3571 [Pleurotus djamor]
MSDHGRQSFTDKVSAAIKPDSQKTTTEHFGDKFKGNTDSAASTLQPNNEKSYGQKATDHLSGNSNHHTHNNDTLGDKTKRAFGMSDNHY